MSHYGGLENLVIFLWWLRIEIYIVVELFVNGIWNGDFVKICVIKLFEWIWVSDTSLWRVRKPCNLFYKLKSSIQD